MEAIELEDSHSVGHQEYGLTNAFKDSIGDIQFGGLDGEGTVDFSDDIDAIGEILGVIFGGEGDGGIGMIDEDGSGGVDCGFGYCYVLEIFDDYFHLAVYHIHCYVETDH